MTIKLLEWYQSYGDAHLGIYEIVYSDRHGNRRTWSLASREKQRPKCMGDRLKCADAVVIVPYHRQRNQLVVIKEFRVALGGFQIGFPAGLIDGNESVQQAVERELAEETGLSVVRHLHCSPALFTSSGLTDESVVMAYVECDGQTSDAGNSGSELIETHFVSPGQAERLCDDSDLLVDVKTWLVLRSFAIHGSL